MDKWKLVLVMLGLLFLLAACGKPLYFTYVEEVEPPIPGVSVQEGDYVTGGFLITNNTEQDVYLYDQQGQEFIKIVGTGGVFRKNEQGQWKPFGENKWTFFGYPPVGYEGPPPKKRGTVVSEWIVGGRVGDTLFEIHGRTVYEPFP